LNELFIWICPIFSILLFKCLLYVIFLVTAVIKAIIFWNKSTKSSHREKRAKLKKMKKLHSWFVNIQTLVNYKICPYWLCIFTGTESPKLVLLLMDPVYVRISTQKMLAMWDVYMFTFIVHIFLENSIKIFKN
jgi:hypothetical protein